MKENPLYQYSNWLINWKSNYSSKSKWKTTIDIYEIILKDEFTDANYWYSVGGSDINYKLSKLSKEDWIYLKEDLVNWESNQIEILSLILTSSDDYFEISDLKTFQSNKSECYMHIITICDNDLFIDLIDDLNFIKLNEKKEVNQLKKIKLRLLNIEHSPIVENEDSKEYFYTRNRFNDFIQLMDYEIKNNCS